MSPREVLLLPMQENDASALTVGGYLQALVRKLWKEGEGFSGKRPFGNSGWDQELQRAVITGGASTGTLDCEGYVKETGDADQVVFEAIEALFPEPWADDQASKIIGAALRAEADKIDPPAA